MLTGINMQHLIKLSFILLCITLSAQTAFADPWFTGPLLAPAGKTIPRGHTNVEVYGINSFTNGRYDDSGTLVHSPLFKTFVANPIISHGFTDWLDVQLTVPYAFNSTQGKQFNRLADISMALGIQLLEQNKSTKRMDVRVLIQETFPTGRYNHLDPQHLGTDSTGLGSYQTQIGLNFQYLLEVFQTHYLRTRLIISRLYASPVHVAGLNSYGGTTTTQGKVDPGTENGIDLAFEYTLTQNWVAVMEGTLAKGKATRFNGELNIGNLGGPSASIGSGDYRAATLAPALEYNFSSNLGLIGGLWFPVAGKNTSHNMTYMLALNAYW
jgi:hypothetical protein